MYKNMIKNIHVLSDINIWVGSPALLNLRMCSDDIFQLKAAIYTLILFHTTYVD